MSYIYRVAGSDPKSRHTPVEGKKGPGRPVYLASNEPIVPPPAENPAAKETKEQPKTAAVLEFKNGQVVTISSRDVDFQLEALINDLIRSGRIKARSDLSPADLLELKYQALKTILAFNLQLKAVIEGFKIEPKSLAEAHILIGRLFGQITANAASPAEKAAIWANYTAALEQRMLSRPMYINDSEIDLLAAISSAAAFRGEKPAYELVDEFFSMVQSLKGPADKIKFAFLLIKKFSEAGRLSYGNNEKLLNFILSVDPKNEIARTKLAQLYRKNGDTGKEKRALLLLLKQYPGSFFANFRLGQIYAERLWIGKAISYLDRAARSAVTAGQRMLALNASIGMNYIMQRMLGEFKWKENHRILSFIADLFKGIKFLFSFQLIKEIISALRGNRVSSPDKEEVRLSAKRLWRITGYLVSKLAGDNRAVKMLLALKKNLNDEIARLQENGTKREVIDYLKGFTAAIGENALRLKGESIPPDPAIVKLQAVLAGGNKEQITKTAKELLGMELRFETVNLCAKGLFLYYMAAKGPKPKEILELFFKFKEKAFEIASDDKDIGWLVALGREGNVAAYKKAIKFLEEKKDYNGLIKIGEELSFIIGELGKSLMDDPESNLMEKKEERMKELRAEAVRAFEAAYGIDKKDRTRIEAKISYLKKAPENFMAKKFPKIAEIVIGGQMIDPKNPAAKLLFGGKREQIGALLRELKLKGIMRGAVVDYSQVRDALDFASKRLNNFSLIGWKILKGKDGAKLVIVLKKKMLLSVTGFGFFRPDSDYGGFGLGVSYLDLWGKGHSAAVSLSVYNKGEDNWDWGGSARYSLPYLFRIGESIPVGADLSVGKGSAVYYKTDGSRAMLDYVGVGAGLEASLSQHTKVGLPVGASWETLSQKYEIKVYGEAIKSGTFSKELFHLKAMPYFRYDTRNRIIGPSSGMFFSYYAGGGSYGGQGYFKTGAEYRLYLPLFKNNSVLKGSAVVLRGNVGYGVSLSENNLFYLGGENSYVRGYSGAFGVGSGFLAANGELRSPLIPIYESAQIYLQPFIYADAGFTFENSGSVPAGYGVGAGIRIFIFGMPISIYYGVPLGLSGGFGFDIGGWN